MTNCHAWYFCLFICSGSDVILFVLLCLVGYRTGNSGTFNDWLEENVHFPAIAYSCFLFFSLHFLVIHDRLFFHQSTP